MGCKRSSHAVYDCKYHLVWCPKRRKKIGEAEIRESIRETIYRIAEDFGFELEEMKIDEEHIHIFLSFPPRYSISKVVGIIKSISASRTFRKHAWLRSKFWSGELWEDGYFVRTVRDKVTGDLIKKYIQRHEQEATNQLELF